MVCRLNAERKDLTVKGLTRENQNDITPGKFWVADILYMPVSSEGHRFILTLTERLSSYVCALPLKSLTVRHVCNAIEVFLAIVPPMEEIATDHGSADFGENFTQLLESYGIRHGGKLPHRSQAQETVELANKLLQNQINKVCAESGTYRFWNKSLPKVVMSINSIHPYRSPYSRTQLLFSVYYHCPLGGPVCLKNPVLAQKVLYKHLNKKRVESCSMLKDLLRKRLGLWANL